MKKRQSGFSMVESLIATFLIVVIVTGVSVVYTRQRMAQKDVSTRSECQERAHSSLANLRSMAIVQGIFPLGLGVDSISSAANPSTNLQGLNNADWLQGSSGRLVVDASGSVAALHSHKLLEGSIAVLNSIYNLSANYCTSNIGAAYQTTSGAELLKAAGTQGSLQAGAETYIRIQVMDIATGTLSCPASPFFLRPLGNTSTPEAVTHGVVQNPGTAALNSAYKVTITTRYNSGDNQDSCAVSGVFQYPQLKENNLNGAVNLFTGIAGGNNYANWDSTVACQGTRPQMAVEFLSPANSVERGLVPFCRDDSVTGAAAPSCASGQSPESVSPSTSWVPCDRVTLCGRPSTVLEPWQSIGGGVQRMRVGYTDVPWGCSARLRMRFVDPALNINVVPDSMIASVPLPGCLSCPALYVGPNYCPPSSMTTYCMAPCSFNGNWVIHGNSVYAYLAATVAFGGSCSGQWRTCNNGSLSGSYLYPSCVVDPPPSPTPTPGFPGGWGMPFNNGGGMPS